MKIPLPGPHTFFVQDDGAAISAGDEEEKSRPHCHFRARVVIRRTSFIVEFFAIPHVQRR